MADGLDFGPQQEGRAAEAAALAARIRELAAGASPWTARDAARVVACDLPVEAGGGGGSLLDALTVAEALGRQLPRATTAALLDAAPVRLMRLFDAWRAGPGAVLEGLEAVGTVDATDGAPRTERRGSAQRLQGDVPVTALFRDARHLLFILGQRGEPLAAALVPAHHASLRGEQHPSLPLQHVAGIVDVELGEGALVESAEVVRALAMEELVRAARAVGECVSACRSDGADAPETTRTVVAARAALYVAAERLWDGGALTLLGADGRGASLEATLEARAVVRTLLQDLLASLLRELPGHPARAWVALDVAALSSAGLRAGPFLKLGETRAGPTHAGRVRAGSSVPRPADVRTPVPEPAGTTDAGEPRRAGARPAARPVDGGVFPFVPEPWRAAQREARSLALEVMDAPASAREAPPADAAWTALAARGWLGPRPDMEQAPQPPTPPMLVAAAEEWGRVAPVLSFPALDTALATHLLVRSGAPGDEWAPLARGVARAALSAGGRAMVTQATTHVVMVEGAEVRLCALEAASAARTLQVLDCAGMPATWQGRGPEGAAVPQAWVELLLVARRLGLASHVLETWRAAMPAGTGDSSAPAYVALGQGWSRLAAARALLWTVTARMAQGSAPGAAADALFRRACALHEDVIEKSIEACGPESFRAGHALARHLETLAVLNGTLRR